MRGSAKRPRGGFTLTEVLVVLAILGVLAAVIAVNYSGILSGAKHKIAVQEVAKLKEVIEQYKLLVGEYPKQQDGLMALTRAVPGQTEPLLNSSSVKDPWGHPYVYVFPGQHGKFDLICLGADGVEGGEGENADVYSWDASEQTRSQSSP